MATVYLARDLQHDRPVALKILHSELTATLGPERFRREVALAAKLQHPHILSVFDSGETKGGQLWFTMPYVDGESLRDRLRRERQLPVDEALRITREVAGALDYAHAQGVIHRDVKPENVMLTARGDALLADFGIARPVGRPGDGTGLTETGMAVGTPQYMSPEQASGERALDARSDVFALGAVCYEMLTGEPPFVGNSAQAVVAKMLSTDAPSVRVLRPAISPALDAVVRRALARVPADRWATAGALGGALTTAERTGAATRVPARRVPVGIALLGLGFLVGVGALFAWRRHEGTVAPAAPGAVSVAVLPFDTEGDTANDYFADGISDEIRGKLSAFPALRLIASASCNQYRRTHKTADQIGRELGVHYLLTGRIQWQSGANGIKRFRISPELVEVRGSAAPETKWQQSYDTTVADVFAVQASVAAQVADQLGVVLSPPAQTQLAARPTQDPAAYDAYLRSLALFGVDPPTVRRALAEAERAVTLDSNFAAAWARVSLRREAVYESGSGTTNLAVEDSIRRAAERAIALAPTAPEGYLARGNYYLKVKNDRPAARAAFENVRRLAPSSAAAVHGLAQVEASFGHLDKALDYARQSAALDPRSPRAATLVSLMLNALGRYPEALAETERGLTLAPGNVTLIDLRSQIRLNEGDLAGARAALRDIPPTLDRTVLLAYVGQGLDEAGFLDSADRALVLTLPPAAVQNDRVLWAHMRGQIYWMAGDTVQARRYADTLRALIEPQLRSDSDSYALLGMYGTALAYQGHGAAATREGKRGLALAEGEGTEGYDLAIAHEALAEIYAAIGDRPHAVDQLRWMVANPDFASPTSPAWFAIDPVWASLRGDPGFERLIAKH